MGGASLSFSWMCVQGRQRCSSSGRPSRAARVSMEWNPDVSTRVLGHLICAQLCVTLRTVACRAPLSRGFSRHEHWRGLLRLPPGDLPDTGLELTPLALAGGIFTSSTSWEALRLHRQTLSSQGPSVDDVCVSQSHLFDPHSVSATAVVPISE